MSEEIALARAWGAASILGRTLRVAGELGGPDAEALLREALDLLRPSVARWEVAAAELALACVTGDDDERLLLLDAALEGAAACGSPGLYARAAAEVVAAGAPAPPDFADVLVLTSTEKRIAELASCGASSSAIAQELFVTPATVERTLADVRSRLGLGPEDDIRPALESH
jgi:hypothetical protein